MTRLIGKLNNMANTNRLGTVEAAYAGSAGAQSNFQGRWLGYDAQGNGLVKTEGRIYSSLTIGSTSIRLNSPVMLRVGKGIKTSNW